MRYLTIFIIRLSGFAAVKSKNVCLHLVDDHKSLMSSGIVQLFTQPHPAKLFNSPFNSKTPPKIHILRHSKYKKRIKIF